MLLRKHLQVNVWDPVILAVKLVHLASWVNPVCIASLIVSKLVSLPLLLGSRLIAFVSKLLIILVPAVYH